MRGITALALAGAAAIAAITAAAPASAADGCGRGFHRGPYGRCHPNGPGPGPGPVVVAPGLVVGNFYRGRGYWDGHRYYQRRERWHDGWRYR